MPRPVIRDRKIVKIPNMVSMLLQSTGLQVPRNSVPYSTINMIEKMRKPKSLLTYSVTDLPHDPGISTPTFMCFTTLLKSLTRSSRANSQLYSRTPSSDFKGNSNLIAFAFSMSFFPVDKF